MGANHRDETASDLGQELDERTDDIGIVGSEPGERDHRRPARRLTGHRQAQYDVHRAGKVCERLSAAPYSQLIRDLRGQRCAAIRDAPRQSE